MSKIWQSPVFLDTSHGLTRWPIHTLLHQMGYHERIPSGAIFIPLGSLPCKDMGKIYFFPFSIRLPLFLPFIVYVFAHLVPFLMPVTQMSFMGSVYTTVALTIERYISVVMPFFRQRHNLKAWMFLSPVATFVVLYSLPRFFELETTYVNLETCTNSTTTDVTFTPPSSSSSFISNNNDGIQIEGRSEEESRRLNFTPVTLPPPSPAEDFQTSRCRNNTVPTLNIKEIRFNPYYVLVCTYAL